MKKRFTALSVVLCFGLVATAQSWKTHAGLYANFSIKAPSAFKPTDHLNHYDLALWHGKTGGLYMLVFDSPGDSLSTQAELLKLLNGSDDSLRKVFGSADYPVQDIIEKKIVRLKNVPAYTALYTTLIPGVGLVHKYHVVQILKGKYFQFSFSNMRNDLPAFIKESKKVVESLVYPTKAPVRERKRNELIENLAP